MFRVTGRVYVQSTGKGLSGLHVKAVDKDLFFDDVVGTAITDKDGRFEITYQQKDFAELFENAPDLYLAVRDQTNRRVLYSSEHNVRFKAGVDENIDVPLPQSALDVADGSYGPERGTVKVRMIGPAALPKEARLFFTEHQSATRRQHVMTVRADKEVSVEVPCGEYTMQLLVPGYETVRGLAIVDSKRAFAIDAALKPRKKTTSTFAERLAKYGIETSQTKLTELNVTPNTTRTLNFRTDRENPGLRILQANTVSKLKQWLGNDDARVGHNRPIFGPLPDEVSLAKLRAAGTDLCRLERSELNAIRALAREFIHGNSSSVAQYESILDQAMKYRLTDAFSHVPIYFYTIVTIGAGAVLEVGNGSAIFTCDELHIHKTGALKPVNSVTIEIGRYVEFQ